MHTAPAPAHTHDHTLDASTPLQRRFAAAAAAALLAAVTLTGCTFTLGASGAEPDATEPATATTTAPETTDPGTTDPGGTRPAGGDAGFIETEAGAIALFQDRWYDNFCSSVNVAMGDENCVGIAIEALEMIDGAADRATAAGVDDDLLAAATAAEDAAAAFRAAECDVYTSDTCVGPTDDFTDAVRAYGDELTERLAAQ
ncbi:hypothetical protein QSU92_13535 [Microbacterium sp. ET2]|uniref:hypothetical protein n=1 Tax=Microbacterium albipurpureum TaxID=3050384 RepID=UPI00259CCBFA|nr:hypothetical protein [Microbacterium sp. ET2 (Ac-2212)]WJL94972.1 hypothetical protein QSU92_13535 [Microbacterium sp. ET2 (Ac-2212)]